MSEPIPQTVSQEALIDDFDYDERECWQCGGDGFITGCSWDWQCDTYAEGEGTCLCARRCDFCNRPPRTPETDTLAKVLSNALKEPRP